MAGAHADAAQDILWACLAFSLRAGRRFDPPQTVVQRLILAGAVPPAMVDLHHVPAKRIPFVAVALEKLVGTTDSCGEAHCFEGFKGEATGLALGQPAIAVRNHGVPQPAYFAHD